MATPRVVRWKPGFLLFSKGREKILSLGTLMSSQVKGRPRRKRRKAQPSEGHVPSVLLSPEQFRCTAPSPAVRKRLPCGCSVGHSRCSGDLAVMAGTEPHDKGPCSLELASRRPGQPRRQDMWAAVGQFTCVQRRPPAVAAKYPESSFWLLHFCG